MWRRKKFIVIAVLAGVLLVGSIGGVALAQTGSSDNTTEGKTLLAMVAEILGIDQQKVEDAFTQAQKDVQEEALDNYLKKLVEEGKITQDQADQYKTWWQSRPDMEPYRQQLREWQQAKPGTPPELKQWQESQPNIPIPGPFGGFGGRGFRGGMRWDGGHCFWGR